MTKLVRASLKQKLFAKKYVQTMGNAQQAALEVYNTTKKVHAANIGRVNLTKPVVQEEIKKILLKKGIDLEWGSEKLKEAIQMNLEEGKPSQAVGADLLKFIFKLHDVIPGAKSLNLSYSKKEVVDKDYSQLKEELTKLQKLTSQLIDDTP